MRALIDADIITTPIGRCVVLGPQPLRCPLADPTHCNGEHCDCPFDIPDVLAVVEACPNAAGCLRALNYHSAFGGPEPQCACDEWQSIHRRVGFVRVLDVLPVVGPYVPHCDHIESVANKAAIWRARAMTATFQPPLLDVEVTPGDVVLVVEPWCRWVEDGPVGHDPGACTDCALTPVTVTHRDGVLGEIEATQ